MMRTMKPQPEVGDYLFCVNPDKEYYGRIFKVTDCHLCSCDADWLNFDGELAYGGTIMTSSYNSAIPFPRPCTEAEIVYAKLMGL